MSVLVRNESSSPYIFEGSRGLREIAAGETELISDDEWGSVPSSKRGIDGLNPLWPNKELVTDREIRFDYVLVGSQNVVQYFGQAPHGSATSAPVWVIKKFLYESVGSDVLVTQIEVIDSAIWDDRDTLDW